MAKTTLFKGVVYLSDEQYNKLVTDGVIEVGGQTITYDESMVYVTPKALPTDYYTKSEVDEKLSQTISKPLVAPTATEIVAVDNTNSQAMLAIGNGLSVENGTLKASGGAGGEKLYEHTLKIQIGQYTSPNIYVKIITKSQTTFSFATLRQYIYEHGQYLSVSSIFKLNETTLRYYQFLYQTSTPSPTATSVACDYMDYVFTTDGNNVSINATNSALSLTVMTDTVTEL